MRACRHTSRRPQARPGAESVHRVRRPLAPVLTPAEGGRVRDPSELPSRLRAEGFTLAEARTLRVSDKRLRARDLVVPTRGVRRAGGLPDVLVDHAAAFALVLPDDVAYSHVTAARLHLLPTPAVWPGPSEPLDTMRDTSQPPVTRSGCRPHKGLETRGTTVREGLRVTDAVDTWVDLGREWSPSHLLAVADVLLRRGLTDHAGLLEAAVRRRGRPGVQRLRDVASLARPGAASPGESLARHRFWSWGLPEPELNVPVLDVHGGWLATGDFVWRRQRVVGEYDGDVHRTDRRTWQRDRTRRAALEDDGWTYVELTSHDLDDARAAEALRRRLLRLLGPAPAPAAEGWRPALPELTQGRVAIPERPDPGQTRARTA